jgi:hypothetical protein
MLVHRAYRGTDTPADLERLLSFYRAGLQTGSFETGIQAAVERMLTSPKFLIRTEPDPAVAARGAVYRVSDLDLASRLSFFLWSSIPDDELLRVAGQGRLKDPAVLEQQTLRMLADPKAEALVENFAGQWLYLRNLRDMIPNSVDFPISTIISAGPWAAKPSYSCERHARGWQRAGSDDGQLHLPQRAAGPALRDSEHLRQPLPARHADRRKPARVIGKGKRPYGDLPHR